ncbi:antitoxin [Magnetospirillum sp. UT-4]|uniref:antitoxin n=1 Tax=Magnetospirillum sp. UT-4 TaxID=2681467 RepID=UPI00138506D0|nr:antitoxin [Magnetospirillum sp. UT-4]CAA7615805.1 conserved hypothetical protein [Magnetospirillum sp. UT-4]
MIKPTTMNGYSSPVTDACERVLVTLLRGLGPYKNSIYLVGGLAPRYLVRARPPTVPPHAGTGDIDVVVDLSILADTEAYSTLEDNLRRMNFERATNEKGQKLSWRWQTKVDERTTLVIEFLADAPDGAAGRLQPLPTEGNISAINIPHSSMVFDLHEDVPVTAELLGGNGLATETVQYADVVSFTCLKAFAFDQRAERKDAHDLVYCLEHAEAGIDAIVGQFLNAQATRHRDTIGEALGILARHFCDDETGEGYRKDGPVAVARFEADTDDEGDRDRRVLRQRQASDIVGRLVSRLKRSPS